MRSKILIAVLTLAVGFLLATNPVVVNASGQIGSAEIKNNAVKSVDIKNNSLKLTDLKTSASNALKTKSYKYTLPATAAAEDHTFNFPGLPEGTYLASFRVFGNTANLGDGILCAFDRPETAAEEGLDYGGTAGFNSLSTTAATVLLNVQSTVSLFCNSNANPTTTWTTETGLDASTVTFTKVHIPVESAATPAPPRQATSKSTGSGR